VQLGLYAPSNMLLDQMHNCVPSAAKVSTLCKRRGRQRSTRERRIQQNTCLAVERRPGSATSLLESLHDDMCKW
jgi:hypothetical protein